MKVRGKHVIERMQEKERVSGTERRNLILRGSTVTHQKVLEWGGGSSEVHILQWSLLYHACWSVMRQRDYKTIKIARTSHMYCSVFAGIRSFAHFWWETWAICSQTLISSEQPERIAHGRSFLVSELGDLLTSLIFGERPEQFAHIAHQKRGNRSFFKNKKTLYKTY